MKLSLLKSMLLTVVIVGSFLRLYNIDHKMRFIWDEGRDMLAIRHMLMNKDLTLFGPFNEIDGKKDFFGVFHYYLLAPSLYLFNYDPLGPALFTALLGVISIVFCYLLIKRWYNEKTALIVTSVYAMSPLMVKYVLWPWNPNTAPFFALLYLLCLTALFKYKKVLLSVISGLLLGLLLQLHYFTLCLGFTWLFFILFSKISHKIIHVGLFIFFFILPNLTFVLFDVTHEHFYLNILKDTFIGQGGQNYFVFNIWNLVSSLWSTTLMVFTNLLGGILVFGLIATLLYWVRSIYIWIIFSKTKAINLELGLSASWMGYCLMVGLFPKLANDYHALSYVIGLLLSVTVVLISLVSCCLKNIKWVNIAIFSIFGFFLIFLFVANKPFRGLTWEENMPMIREISRIIAQNTGNDSFNVASLVDADTRGTRFRYFLDVYGKEPLGIYAYPESSELFVIVRNLDKDYNQNPAWELASFKSSVSLKIGDVGEYQVWKFDKLTKK